MKKYLIKASNLHHTLYYGKSNLSTCPVNNYLEHKEPTREAIIKYGYSSLTHAKKNYYLHNLQKYNTEVITYEI